MLGELKRTNGPMANREQLQIIRSARAGQAAAQLALGKRYLVGGGGLPRSAATALYWLDRAAHQQEPDAWMLIGSQVPFEIARQATQPSALCTWYERAFDAGVIQAGLVLARLVFTQPETQTQVALQRKACHALQAAAQAGLADAQWLLAQRIGSVKPSAAAREVVSSAPLTADRNMLKWARHAADSGVLQAQHALAEHAWASASYAAFLQRSLPLARAVLQRTDRCSSFAEAQLLFRTAQALLQTNRDDENDIVSFLDCAAHAGHREAQLSLGLWFARMDEHGSRSDVRAGIAHYKKSIRWLTMAGEQGASEAWYALSKIYLKPEFSQRNVAEAQRYLVLAAEAGYCKAQLDLGMSIWRTRRGDESGDVRALFWLQKAAAQGSEDAVKFREKHAAGVVPAPWAHLVLKKLTREALRLHPFLVARIELAAQFGLSQPEALLIDLNRADCGHCLLVDIRADYSRAKRRLIAVQTGEERQALDRIVRLFGNIDCGPGGPEGNYRQRRYRLSVLSGA